MFVLEHCIRTLVIVQRLFYLSSFNHGMTTVCCKFYC